MKEGATLSSVAPDWGSEGSTGMEQEGGGNADKGRVETPLGDDKMISGARAGWVEGAPPLSNFGFPGHGS